MQRDSRDLGDLAAKYHRKDAITVEDEEFGVLYIIEGNEEQDNWLRFIPLIRQPEPILIVEAPPAKNSDSKIIHTLKPGDQFLARSVPDRADLLEVALIRNQESESDSDKPKNFNIAKKGYIKKSALGKMQPVPFNPCKEDLFPDQSPDIKDIKQGGFGNCFLLSGLIAILAQPGGKEYIKNEMFAQDGEYVIVRLFEPDKFKPIYIRVKNSRYNEDEAIKHPALWVHILEKAYTALAISRRANIQKDKYKFQYQFPAFQAMFTNGESPATALNILTGLPANEFMIIPPESLWNADDIRIFAATADTLNSARAVFGADHQNNFLIIDRFLQETTAPIWSALEALQIEQDKLDQQIDFDKNYFQTLEQMKTKLRIEKLHIISYLRQLRKDIIDPEKRSELLSRPAISASEREFQDLIRRAADNPECLNAISNCINSYRSTILDSSLGGVLKTFNSMAKLSAYVSTPENADHLKQLDSNIKSKSDADKFIQQLNNIPGFPSELSEKFCNHIKNNFIADSGSNQYSTHALLIYQDICFQLKRDKRLVVASTLQPNPRYKTDQSIKDPQTELFKSLGLIEGHAYGVIDLVEEKGLKFLILRNPWGNTGRVYKDILHPELKATNEEILSAGTFKIELNEFVKYFAKYTSTPMQHRGTDTAILRFQLLGAKLYTNPDEPSSSGLPSSPNSSKYR